MSLSRKVLHTLDELSAQADTRRVAVAGGAILLTANRAYLLPFQLPDSISIDRLAWFPGADGAGNADCGIYDSTFALKVSTGAVTKTNAFKVQTVSAVTLQAGLYYWAWSQNGTTSMTGLNPGSATLADLIACGCVQMDAAHPLPATVVPATISEFIYPCLAAANGAFLL